MGQQRAHAGRGGESNQVSVHAVVQAGKAWSLSCFQVLPEPEARVSIAGGIILTGPGHGGDQCLTTLLHTSQSGWHLAMDEGPLSCPRATTIA